MELSGAIAALFGKVGLYWDQIVQQEEGSTMISYQTLTPHNPDWMTAANQISVVEWPAGAHLAKHMLTATWQPWEKVIYATDAGKLVGFCALLARDIVPDTTYTPFVSSVYVAPAYRGEGISLTLVRAAETAAKDAAIQDLYIVTRHEGLYEHLDYEMIDQQTDQFGRLNHILHKSL